MQGSISVHRLNTFRQLLTEGATYEIRRFDVISSNAEFQVLRFKRIDPLHKLY